MERGRWLSHEWDDGCVLFDRASGDTHALDALCAEVLHLRESGSRDAAAISARLAEELDLDPETLLADVERALEQLDRLEFS